MGESFTPQLSTGTVTFGLPLKLPAARGGVQPRLDLSYSSASGFGLAGNGWSVGASAITRQTDRGVPRYQDQSDWTAEQDRFVFGSMELVPICTVRGTTCDGARPGEVMPAWADGWQYFRSRIEGGFLRFFWSPDHKTWRGQSKDGGNVELGVPLDGSGYTGALEANPDRSAEIYRWYIVRQYDSEGGVNGQSSPAPINSIVYRYQNDHGSVYLSDLYDTSPADNPTTTNLALYAHHTRLVYEARPDVTVSYRPGWEIQYGLRLLRVDVTSKPFAGPASAPRVAVRRYHFSYDSAAHTSLLAAVHMEGRCANPESEGANEDLPVTNCPTLPEQRFEYQHVQGSGNQLADSQGYTFEDFAENVSTLANSPPRSLDDSLTNLMDVNGDSLPDVVVTAPALYNGGQGVYFNGLDPSKKSIGFGSATTVPVQAVGNVDAGVLLFNNPTVSALDVEGRGLANLIHMPQAKQYEVFAPVFSSGKWSWQGRSVTTASEQDVKIDFTREARNTQVMDVNGDGLVDVVYSSPTEYQTFFSLGRFPGGADQFGHATRTSATTADISNDPVTACAPWSALPVRFSDSDAHVADMNGDGLPDIVRVRPGQVLYWPGRGNGFWGTGARNDCAGGSFAVNRHIEMFSAPQFGITDPGTLLLGDVNGDGLADMVEVRNQDVDIYLNDNGLGWTARHTIRNTPVRPNGSNYVRITDIDGSGSPDILWGHGYDYRYIDLTGGIVPRLLTKMHNGLGMTTELSYSSSAELMRQAIKALNPWSEPLAPTSTAVVVRIATRDHLDAVGRPEGVYATELSYRDPVYEGREREFRGFREATVKTIGDGPSPTSLHRTTFLLGECPSYANGTSADVCNPSALWQDNWAEALRGLPALEETFDERGVYLSTEHTKYELRQLYTGRDGRRVIVPYSVARESFVYDTAAFDSSASTVALDEVDFNLTGVQTTRTRPVIRRANAGTAFLRSRTTHDDFGNTLDSIQDGCVDGCTAGVDESVIAHSDFNLTPGDPSGWLFRESHAYVTGSVHNEIRSERYNYYNAQGKLTEQHAVLGGTLPLDRFHEQKNRPIAPAPTNASGGIDAPADVLMQQNSYDAFGHITLQRGPNGRCSSGEVDSAYAQLPTASHVFVGTIGANGCGQTDLVHQVTYDRGLEAVTDSLDATGQPAHFEYDGFARLLSSTFADPDRPGNLAAAPTLIASYDLPTDASARPYSITVVQTADGANPSTFSYRDGWSFTDGLGRSLASVTQADVSAGDSGDHVIGRVTQYDAKGAAARVYEPRFYTGNLAGVPLGLPPLPSGGDAVRFTSQSHDAFGRPTDSYALDLTLTAHVVYHALSKDTYDAADIGPGPRAGTYVSVVADGHGRGVRRTERLHVSGGAIEERHTINEYLPSGQIFRVTQRKTGVPDVVRWLRYDTLGRKVLNVEPNTSVGFNPDPSTSPSLLKAWRYAYDDAGDLVGVSDARGCGTNYFYDAGGRLLAEDRSPCQQQQAAYTAPDLSTGDGTEAFYRYDVPDPDGTAIVDAAGARLDIDSNLLLGRLVSVSGLGSKSVFRYDALGRGTGSAVRLASTDTPPGNLAKRYAPTWYMQTQSLDALDRVISATTGATVPELLAADGTSRILPTYSKRGSVASVGSSYGTLVASMTYAADGLLNVARLGDAAATQREYTYDGRRRVQTVQAFRAEAPLWTSSPTATYSPPAATDPPTEQLALEYFDFHYDDVSNITKIEDFRNDADWPASAKPVTRTFEYDDLYRLTRTTFSYAGSSVDAWLSPYTAEDTDKTRQPQPSPQVSFSRRPARQDYRYDWLGSFSQTTDDQNGFWDRSLGSVTVGTAPSGPHQIQAASNRTLASGGSRVGDLSVSYDAAGSMTGLVVRRTGPCLPTGASCVQRFAYDWNEVGELTRARRWDLNKAEQTKYADLTATPPNRPPDAELQYAYNASGGRVRKTAVDGSGSVLYTLYVFPTLEIRGTTWDTKRSDYVVDRDTENVRLSAGVATARIVYTSASLPEPTGSHRHVLLEFSDQIGSTNYVVDQATGELVEFATYNTYGSAESDYRPGRWGEFREPYRFSGKEEDIELGLSYFGARYYSPYLGTWTSADPATIHDLKSDTNPYAYVHGSPAMITDPDGRVANFVIGAAVGFAVGFVSSVTIQAIAHHGDLSKVNYGLHGALGAGLVGAAAGATGGLAGGAVATAVGGGVGGATVGGAAGAVAAATVSYAGNSWVNRSSMTWKGYGTALTIGVVGGAAGGAVGGALGQNLGGALAGGATGAGTSYATAIIFGQHFSTESLMLSLGSGIAAAAAVYGLSPPKPSGYDTLEQAKAARNAELTSLSQQHKVEYASIAYENEGRYNYTTPTTINDSHASPTMEELASDLPDGANVLDYAHTHPSTPSGPRDQVGWYGPDYETVKTEYEYANKLGLWTGRTNPSTLDNVSISKDFTATILAQQGNGSWQTHTIALGQMVQDGFVWPQNGSAGIPQKYIIEGVR